MKKFALKKYYRIEFELQSPLALGCGCNDETDSDVLLDSQGEPFIPGSSLAGAYRALLDEKTAEKFFGKRLVDTNEIDESHIIVYDAMLKKSEDEASNTEKEGKEDATDNFYKGKRDMVALDDYKTAESGAKFDFQIIEPYIKFVTYIEQTVFQGEEIDNNAIPVILNQWKNNGISFGSKTMRGFGKTMTSKIYEKKFSLPKDIDKWINFDIYSYDEWEDFKDAADDVKSAECWSMTLLLNQKGGLSIREYSTKVGEADYEQLKLNCNKKKTAVIPGTSWAGAFRAQMKKLGMKTEDIRYIFGSAKTKKKSPQQKENCKSDDLQKGKNHKSHIMFSESYIKDGSDITYSRNAIDRFTGGTVDGALYTESTRYNGTGIQLVIGFDDEDSRKKAAPYLAAAIMDLHMGYMAVGGLTAVGRGIFEVEKVNGSVFEVEESDPNAAYTKLMRMIEEGKQNG